MKIHRILLAVVVLAVATVADAVGQTSAAASFDQGAFKARRQAVENRLAAAIEAFESGELPKPPAPADDWKKYLDWSSWAGPSGKPVDWDPGAMARIAKRLFAADAACDSPLVHELRAAMVDYLNFREAVSETRGDVAGECARRIAQLQQATAGGGRFADVEDAAWWLAATDQAGELLDEVRAVYSGPMIVGHVHREMVEEKLAAFENTSEEVRRTTYYMRGSKTIGAARVKTETKARLTNGEDNARVRVEAIGQIDTPRSVSRSASVLVESASQAEFTATAEVFWGGSRFEMTEPEAKATFASQIKRIEAPRATRPIVEAEVRDAHGEAEERGSRKVAREAQKAMAPKLAAVVDRINHKSQGILGLMRRSGTTARQWQSRVLDNSVEIDYWAPTAHGLAAPKKDVPGLVGDETIGLSFHDSAIEAILRNQVAGVVWTDVDFATLQREITGGNHEEFHIGLMPERWSAQWSWRLPVRIHFTPEAVQVRYRFARAEVDGESYEASFEVQGDLKVAITPYGLRLHTQLPVRIEPLDKSRPLPPVFADVLGRKFNGLFGEHFYLDGFQFPAGGHLDPLSRFRVLRADLEPGWIHLRYSNRQPASSIARHETATAVAP